MTTARSTRAASIQCHSQEDGAFKSDRTSLGAGCTLGVGAFVHYGVTMGDGAVLAPDSFLMKGEEMPPHARGVETRPGRCASTRAICRSEGCQHRRQAAPRSSAVRDQPAGVLKDIAEHPVLGDMAELLHREHAEEPLASADGI